MPLTGRQGPEEFGGDDKKLPGNNCDTEQFTSLHDRALTGPYQLWPGSVETIDTHVTLTTLERVFSAYWYTEPDYASVSNV